MKKTLSILIFAIAVCAAHAQKKQKDSVVVIDDPNRIYVQVEQYPTFPGGLTKFADYLKSNLKYPDQARNEGVQGVVLLTCIVEKDGSFTDVKVVRRIGNGCDEEACRLIKNSAKWNPARQNGEAVRVYYTIPVRFSLAAK